MDPLSSAEHDSRVNVAFRIINILLATLLFTVLVLAALPNLGLNVLPKNISETGDSLTLIFIALSVVLVILGFVSKKVILKISRKHADPTKTINSSIQLFLTSHLVAFIIFEAIALVGIVSFLTTGNYRIALALNALSVISMFIAWPKIKDLKSKIERDLSAET